MKRLKRILPKKSGRDSQGHIAIRHQGGRHKRFLRTVDYARGKHGIDGHVEALEYDPNRNARLALVLYPDGDRRYVIAPQGLNIGDKIMSGETAPIKPGNSLPLGRIPVGTLVYNLEITLGKGGQMVRSGQSNAIVQGRESGIVLVKLPSGELRRFSTALYATVGQVSGQSRGVLRKAGTRRHMGIRPTVRGVAMAPRAHPHGGGEGRSPEGMPPKTPWGKPARGVKTRRPKKYSDRLIVSGRPR
ncbi:MAG: 50S ribosomal protein L2 [Candidatus Blackburnbacteria bacterium]|nr:50S ribosomal protein L2 [Candidatus Blackburnbacteria bacterium]